MLKEVCIILGRDKQYWQAFELCIEELEDPYFATEVCNTVFEAHRDESVFFDLFQILIKYDYSLKAMDLLEKNFSKMPARRVLALIQPMEKLGPKHFKILELIYKDI